MNQNDSNAQGKQQTSSLNCSSQLLSNTPKVPSNNTFIHTSNMTNGAVLYAPLSPHSPVNKDLNGNLASQSTYERDLLHQIIANDVQLQSNTKITESNVDSRSMVVRNTPDGTVQITYRKMVNTLPVKSNNLAYILPKPPSHKISSTYENYALQNIPFSNGLSPQVVPCPVQRKNTKNSSKHIKTSNIIDNNQSNGKDASVNGTVKNLSINLPKMQHTSTTVRSLTISNQEAAAITQSNINYLSSSTAANYICSSPHADTFTCSSLPKDPVVNSLNSYTHSSNFNNDPLEFLNQSIATQNFISTESNFQSLDNLEMDLESLNTEPLDNMTYKNDLSSLFTASRLTNSMPSYTTDTLLENIVNHHTCSEEQSIDLNPHLVDNHQTNSIEYPMTSVFNNSVQLPVSYQTNTALVHVTPQTKTAELIDIIDVSPEIATTSGGNKIILIGSWNAKDARYCCKFGDSIVNAVLIQNGVLRCYSPEYKPSKVKLCVLRNGSVVSKEMDFEFVDPTVEMDENIVNHDSWLSISSTSLEHLLRERIAAISEIMGVENILNIIEAESNFSNAEEKLVLICKQLVEVEVDFQFDYNVEETMTVLHLAASLGYMKLIQLLLSWVESKPNKLISVEACPTRCDQFKLLPIMWSAAKGHFNTTCVLHQWDESTIQENDTCGCTAIDLAKECGHSSLVSYLERVLKKSNGSKDGTTDVCMNSSFNEPSSVVSQAKSSDYGEGSRTLGKTLAHIQSIISEEHVDENTDICSDGEESIFETSPFTPRQRSIADESRTAVLSINQLSPASPAQTSLQSPFNRQVRETAEFCEFFFKAKTIEKDFAELTLTGEEQEDLYKAANVIQTAFKSYKDRRKQRDNEFSAAVLIQSYYRRYKQYAAFKKMQKGAVIIQSQYRAHREKSKKKCHAASVIQTYYRRYMQRKHDGRSEDYQLKNKLKQQAERKNNRFITQSTKRFSRDFADTFINAEYSHTENIHDHL